MINLEFTWNGRTIGLKNKSEELKWQKIADFPVDSENLKIYNSNVFLLQSAAELGSLSWFCHDKSPVTAAMAENLQVREKGSE